MKKALIVICKTLGEFVNTLNVAHKYSLLTRDNLMQPIQMQLSLIKNFFSQFFPAFPKSILNFELFQNEYHPYSSCTFENTESKKRG